ncbi:5-guanidino-2-oxopentanoate decarboxylase [Limimaricola pyoseonensis]|uniref:Acetolactate synthase-1/2/3 large subunit n=1 Tax=Limimaricola pyoseonensis TaxID=521013 RepID=A0A1G7D5B6_9RHOB|nr:5-guanidino-2-oxopentanoate decarboxylase [Limimaricola pyoseonensis]SDE46220.1 acetolactate synthase-1/2/3 large subunit [Limimaricola pyoseonensis]
MLDTEPMTRPLGAQISHALAARGVEVIFGIPGVHNQEMYRGIEEAGLRHVLARHEQGAGFMADGYARATGRPGVAYVITGPGLCNILTPLGQSWSDSVAVLAISSCLPEGGRHDHRLHEMRDQRAAAAAVTEWSEEARDAEHAYALVDRALLGFEGRRRRPVHIQVPIPALEAAAKPAAPRSAGPRRAAPPDPGAVARAARLLAEARRPMLLLGGGAAGAATEARALAARLGAASFASYAGRGVIDSGAPLHYGCALARPDSAAEIGRADAVLVVGCALSETDLWRADPGFAADAKVIRFDIDPAILAADHRADLRIAGDAAEGLGALRAALGEAEPATLWQPDEVAAARDRWRAAIAAERPGLVPVIEALRAALPADATVFSDMTQLAYAALELWPARAPGLWHHPSGFGTLGYALPAAIGAKVGCPGRPVVALAGDYGLQYTIQELGTAVELGLPLPIIVWDNGKLGEIEDSMTAAQIAPNAVIQRNPDFCALARAWGAAAERPQNLEELRDTVALAFATRGPTLIHLTPAAVR